MAESSSAAQRPDSLKKLRACRTCKLIKTADQFYESYCENCPHKRPDVENPSSRDEFVQSETTADFEGMVSMMQPSNSWVARWLRMRSVDDDGNVIPVKAGLYAISLPGEEAKAGSAQELEEEDLGEEERDDGDQAYDDAEEAQLGADPAAVSEAIDNTAIREDDDGDE